MNVPYSFTEIYNDGVYCERILNPAPCVPFLFLSLRNVTTKGTTDSDGENEHEEKTKMNGKLMMTIVHEGEEKNIQDEYMLWRHILGGKNKRWQWFVDIEY